MSFDALRLAHPSSRLALGLLALTACNADSCGTSPQEPDCQSAGQICTVVGTGEFGLNGDGLPALESHIYLPSAVEFDSQERAVFVDFFNLRVRRVEEDGTLITVAGSGWHDFAQDGSEAVLSPLENPVDVAVDLDDTLYVAELHAGRVLSVDPSGWLTVLAGNGEIRSEGDDGPAREASITELDGLALDGDLLYIADTLAHRIRVVDLVTETIHPVAGTGDEGGTDGPSEDATFQFPDGLLLADGGVYVAERQGHRVRFIDLELGEVRTVAGTGTPDYTGDGGPATEATLNQPQGLAMDDEGRLYIADAENHVIRRVLADGTIETVVGTGAAGEGPDVGYGLDVSLAKPTEATFAPDGRLWIVDQLNSRIRAWVIE